MNENCSIIISQQILVFQEGKSKLTIRNIDRFECERVKVDGCMITVGIRCDYLLIGKNVEHFIELKGQDINHAIKQIESTISQLSKNKSLQKKISFIICTRSPMVTATIQNWQVIFKRKYNSHLIVKSTPADYNL